MTPAPILDEEIIVWTSVADSLPDSDTTVMTYCPTDDAEPVWLGWYEGDGEWRAVDGAPFDLDTVTAWAPMPRGPERTEEAPHG